MISIEILNKKGIPNCLTISRNLLGKNFHDFSYFDSTIKTKQCLIAVNKKKIIGFLVLQNSFDPKEKIGFIDSICVASKHQNKGIGSSLIKEAINYLKRKNNTIVVHAWKHHETINLENTLLSNGFLKINSLGNIWKTACENNNFSCPVKEDICICTAELYHLNLNVKNKSNTDN